MRLKHMVLAIGLASLAFPASAQLEVYTDYEVSDEVWLMTTVKVDANMGDYYLEGLKSTWIASNEAAKDLGHIEGYSIMSSAFPQSGDFNMVLVIKFASMADLAPSKAKYDAFMTAWGEANQDSSRETSKTYPDIRTIVGEYVFHELTMN